MPRQAREARALSSILVPTGMLCWGREVVAIGSGSCTSARGPAAHWDAGTWGDGRGTQPALPVECRTATSTGQPDQDGRLDHGFFSSSFRDSCKWSARESSVSGRETASAKAGAQEAHPTGESLTQCPGGQTTAPQAQGLGLPAALFSCYED